MAGSVPYVNQFTRPSHSYMYFHHGKWAKEHWGYHAAQP